MTDAVRQVAGGLANPGPRMQLHAVDILHPEVLGKPRGIRQPFMRNREQPVQFTSCNSYVKATAKSVTGSAMALSVLAGASAASAADMTVPPPLSHQKAIYFAKHPAEWAAIMARAPKARMVTPAPAPSGPPRAGGWSSLANTAPTDGLSNPLLLTDGTVIVHQLCTAHWYKLTPNAKGSYIKGSWSQIADAPWQPLYFASQILNDGRVVGNGGEYDGASGCSATWQTGGGVYDPVANTWKSLAPPKGWTTIGDAQSVMLPDKSYMLANCCTTDQAILNDRTLKWTPTGSGKFDVNDEEGWALLQSGKVLTSDAYVFQSSCGANTELYDPSTGAWTGAGTAPRQLSDCLAGGNQSFEVGPIAVRPTGSAVAFSGVTTGVAGTAIYDPTSASWSAGPDLPTISGQNYNLADAPAAVLPSGNVLFAASPGLFTAPTHYFEFTGNNTILQRTDPAGATGHPSYVVNFLMLPTGQVLQTDFTNSVQIYTPTGSFKSSKRPSITSVPGTLTRNNTYTVAGTQLNGVTHAVYGDDQQAATNFPLVQLVSQSTGNVYYAATSQFSTRGIGPNKSSTANFLVPSAVPVGAYNLSVIANGIPSLATSVTVN